MAATLYQPIFLSLSLLDATLSLFCALFVRNKILLHTRDICGTRTNQFSDKYVAIALAFNNCLAVRFSVTTSHLFPRQRRARWIELAKRKRWQSAKAMALLYNPYVSSWAIKLAIRSCSTFS